MAIAKRKRQTKQQPKKKPNIFKRAGKRISDWYWGVIRGILALFRCYVMYFPLYIAPYLLVKENDVISVLVIVLIGCILLGYVPIMFDSSLSMAKNKFKKVMVFFLRIGFLFCIVRPIIDVVMILGTGSKDYTYWTLTVLGSYVLSYLIYLGYKKLLVGKIIGTY